MLIEITDDHNYHKVNPHQIVEIRSESRESQRCTICLSTGEDISMSMPVSKVTSVWEDAIRDWYMRQSLHLKSGE